MFFRSKRHIKRQLLIGVIMALAISLCCLAYFAFLYLDGHPQAEDAAAKIIHNLKDDQLLTDMRLDLNLNPAHLSLRGEAKLSFTLPENRGCSLLRKLLFFIPTDIVFFLHPDLRVDRIQWGERNLDMKRIKSTVYVDIKGQPPEDGVVDLEIQFSGKLSDKKWSSIFTPDLIYLDPIDNYYPNQGPSPCRVTINLQTPPGYANVIPDSVARKQNETWRLNESSFALAAGLFEMVSHKTDNLEYEFYGWGDGERKLATELAKIQRFYSSKLAQPALKKLCFIRSPIPLETGMRQHKANGILLSQDLSDEEMAYAMAQFWLGPDNGEENSLFSRDELAYGMALYFIHQNMGRQAFLKSLDRIAKKTTLAMQVRKSGSEISAEDSVKSSGFQLSALRRRIGNRYFDQILSEILSMKKENKAVGPSHWINLCYRITGENLIWFFRDWVHQEGELDLGIHEFSETRSIGMMNRVKLVFKNLGNLNFPEKVKVQFITESGGKETRLVSAKSADPGSPFVLEDDFEEKIIAVVLDPDLELYDSNRHNNTAYLAPQPYYIMPSEDNRFIAVAYHKEVKSERFPLVILTLPEMKIKEEFGLDYPVGNIQWIDEKRLLVSAAAEDAFKNIGDPGPPRLLIDIMKGHAEVIDSKLDLSFSHSGRYLLINNKKNGFWRHKVRDLDQKLTKNTLNKIPYRLRWLPGSDLVMPVYPPDYVGNTLICSHQGDCLFGVGENYKLSHFYGYQGDLAFVMERNGEKGVYLLSDPKGESKCLAMLSGEPLGLYRSKFDGMIFLKEQLPDNRIRIIRIDPSQKKKAKTLFEDPAEGLCDIFSQKGLLSLKVQNGYPDIHFYSFEDKEGRFITESSASEKVLALVGNKRWLYYAKEIQGQDGSVLGAFKQYTFCRFDFLSWESTEIFQDWRP